MGASHVRFPAEASRDDEGFDLNEDRKRTLRALPGPRGQSADQWFADLHRTKELRCRGQEPLAALHADSNRKIAIKLRGINQELEDHCATRDSIFHGRNTAQVKTRNQPKP